MIYDIDPFGTWINALPSDIKKKLSLHDFKRLWHGAKDVLRRDREPSGATTNDAPIVPREPTGLMLHKGLREYAAAYADHLSGTAIVGQAWRAMHDAATGTTVSESRDDG